MSSAAGYASRPRAAAPMPGPGEFNLLAPDAPRRAGRAGLVSPAVVPAMRMERQAWSLPWLPRCVRPGRQSASVLAVSSVRASTSTATGPCAVRGPPGLGTRVWCRTGSPAESIRVCTCRRPSVANGHSRIGHYQEPRKVPDVPRRPPAPGPSDRSVVFVTQRPSAAGALPRQR